MYRRVRELFRAKKFDVVHTHNLPGVSPAVGGHPHRAHHPRPLAYLRAGHPHDPAGPRVCDRQCDGCALRGDWLRRLSRAVGG